VNTGNHHYPQPTTVRGKNTMQGEDIKQAGKKHIMQSKQQGFQKAMQSKQQGFQKQCKFSKHKFDSNP
jgi:hypothetical protein